MAHRLIITPDAEADIRSARRWIAEHLSLTTANRWFVRVIKRSYEIAETPEVFPEAAEAATLGLDLREAHMGRRPHVYRFLFTVDREIVYLHRIRHSSRDWLTTDDL